ncbi:hypothetical protein GCM10010397_22170 [Streptomyces spinoverrucosus]|nr:hypothetical protein GCM10010397_22170 [Streptomyces spinoverrucosus]
MEVAGAIVDQHVNAVGVPGDVGSEVADRGRVRQVAGEGVDMLVPSATNLVADTFSGGESARGEEDLGAEVRETDGQSASEIAAGGGNDHAVIVESHVGAPGS